jgi:NAD(P)H-flavin reductase/hemoglobin-like flavoprotein
VVDAQRLKSSFATVAQYGDEVPLFFYSFLFLSYPEVREMFPVSMAGQRDKLVGALGRVLSNVDNLDELVPFLRQLGQDHRKFAVIGQHYPAVGASLLATLEHFLGDEWTPELAGDWQTAYGLVAKVMQEAAQDASASTPPWWEAEVISHERPTLDVAVIRVRTDQRLHYLPGQSLAVETDLRPRMWRYYSPANAPRDDHEIEFHVRLVAGGPVSPALVQVLRPGDILRLGAPVGRRLTLDPGSRGDLVLIAGGTGLSPLRAVIDQLVRADGAGSEPESDRPTPRRVSLFAGAQSERELYPLPSLLELARQHSWLSVVPAVSDDLSYPGEHGMAVDVALKRGPWVEPQVYVCGSPHMVTGSVGRLVDAGISTERIHVEDFSTERFSMSGGGREGGWA